MTPSALTPAARGSGEGPLPAAGKPQARGPAPARPAAGGRAAAKPAARGRAAARPAARGRAAARPAAPPRGAGHRSAVRRQVSPRSVRRWSGPLAGLTRKVRARPEQPLRAPTRQTTREGGSRRASAAATKPVRAPWSARATTYISALPDHALLDRLIRGRVWIPLLGVLLAGIVAMQVEVLKLNAGIGRSLQRATALQSQNDLLRANVSQLADARRIERLAAKMGMVMPAPSRVKFLSTGPGVTERALSSIHEPSGAAYADTIHAAAAAAAAADPSLSATSTATTATGTAIGTPAQTPGVLPQGGSTAAAAGTAAQAATSAATPAATSAGG